MPVMDGMTATREIRAFEHERVVAGPQPTGRPALKRQRSHILALTGLASEVTKLEALQSGVDQYLIKPVQFAGLIKLLRDINIK
jgi:CheY-like chemotaxis protein